MAKNPLHCSFCGRSRDEVKIAYYDGYLDLHARVKLRLDVPVWGQEKPSMVIHADAKGKQQKEEEELKKKEAERLKKLEEEQKKKYAEEIAKQEAEKKAKEEAEKKLKGLFKN